MPGIPDIAQKNVILDLIFGAALGGADWSLALLLTEPDSTGGGISEPSGFGYSRITYADNATNFPAAAAGIKRNGTAINFGTASGGDWGTDMYGIGFFKGGDIKYWAEFSGEVTILDGEACSIPANALTISVP